MSVMVSSVQSGAVVALRCAGERLPRAARQAGAGHHRAGAATGDRAEGLAHLAGLAGDGRGPHDEAQTALCTANSSAMKSQAGVHECHRRAVISSASDYALLRRRATASPRQNSPVMIPVGSGRVVNARN